MSITSISFKHTLSVGAAMIVLVGMGLSACQKHETSVLCQGVGKNGDGSVLMTKGMCKKLADGKAVPTNLVYHDPGANAYVECLGVAAAGENDCATNSSACGGTASRDRDPNAWIAIPGGICNQLKDSKVGTLTTAQINTLNAQGKKIG